MYFSRITCGKCGGVVSKTTTICPHCGVRLAGIKCKSCGFYGSENDFPNDRCPKCGVLVQIDRDIPKAPSAPPGPPVVWNAETILFAILTVALLAGCGISFISFWDLVGSGHSSDFLLGIGLVVLSLLLMGGTFSVKLIAEKMSKESANMPGGETAQDPAILARAQKMIHAISLLTAPAIMAIIFVIGVSSYGPFDASMFRAAILFFLIFGGYFALLYFLGGGFDWQSEKRSTARSILFFAVGVVGYSLILYGFWYLIRLGVAAALHLPFPELKGRLLTTQSSGVHHLAKPVSTIPKEESKAAKPLTTTNTDEPIITISLVDVQSKLIALSERSQMGQDVKEEVNELIRMYPKEDQKSAIKLMCGVLGLSYDQ